ncbi:HNH endonuclease [Brevibacterium permense]|uniref:HNH endonuclease n=1 Tax=Brevibacterium permense TaxID=234834 RepID=UPI0021D0EE24|nr:HNH endonuclease signature motif containing protein [Brevibacterium permense]MCU4297326.1 HNH endonuclease [Brevibacterium permense]
MDVDSAREPAPVLYPLTEIARFGELLRGLDPGGTEAETLERITALEELKSAVVAAQSREAVAFEALRIERDRLNRVPALDCGKRAGDEVGLAKKVSPGSGRKFLSTARSIVIGMPNTFKALSKGEISEDKARIMVDETAVLAGADRRKVDTRMKRSLGPTGLRSLRAEVRALSAEMDAEAAAKRAAKAESNRRVNLTVIDDGMARISAILPLTQAVAAYESLRAGTESITAAGDAGGRNRRQVLADTFVERLSGQTSATAVPAEIHVLVEAESLLSDGLVPAWMPGFGPLPAQTARKFIAANEAKMFISRIFTRPDDGQLVGMDAKSREFTGRLRQMITFRDDVCRTPWCDAPIRHADHALPVAAGGATTWENGSGLCASCNYAKEHPGWKHEATADGLRVTTPSGRSYEVTTPAVVRRMRFPRPEAVSESGGSPPGPDWRQTFSRFLEPDRDKARRVGEEAGTDEPQEAAQPDQPVEYQTIEPKCVLPEQLPPRYCTRAEKIAGWRSRNAHRRPSAQDCKGSPVESHLVRMVFGPD